MSSSKENPYLIVIQCTMNVDSARESLGVNDLTQLWHERPVTNDMEGEVQPRRDDFPSDLETSNKCQWSLFLNQSADEEAFDILSIEAIRRIVVGEFRNVCAIAHSVHPVLRNPERPKPVTDVLRYPDNGLCDRP
jgi:hypothetical protein